MEEKYRLQEKLGKSELGCSCGSSIVIVGNPDSYYFGNDEVAAWVEQNQANSLQCQAFQKKNLQVNQKTDIQPDCPPAETVGSEQMHEIGSVPYLKFRIRIYEKLNQSGHKMYYYSPAVILQPESAVGQLNSVTQEAQLYFRVLMWNTEIEETVLAFLNGRDDEVSINQVQMIAFQQVMLQGSCRYRLPTSWTPYHMNRSVVFSINCPSKESADVLAVQMKRDPQQFAHLRVKFSLVSNKIKKQEPVFVYVINIPDKEETIGSNNSKEAKHLLRRIESKLQDTLNRVDDLQQRLLDREKDRNEMLLDLADRLGFVELESRKTRSVYFVARAKAFCSLLSRSIITYQSARLNVGSAMNLSSGIFQVPRSGLYQFSFQAKTSNSDVTVSLLVQETAVMTTHSKPRSTSSFTSILSLKVGDRVAVRLDKGYLTPLFEAEPGEFPVQFSGVLLEETDCYGVAPLPLRPPSFSPR